MSSRFFALLLPILLFFAATGAPAQQTSSFSPTALAVPLSVTTGSARIPLPSPGPTALLINTGSVTAYVNLGSATINATTSGVPIGPGCATALSSVGQSYIAGITASGSTTLTVITGAGLPTLPPVACSASGGGGGAVTVAGGADVTEGTIGDTSTTGTVVGFLRDVQACDSKIAISQTTSTDLHTMSLTGHICTVMLISADAENVSLVDGTGSVCGTGTAAIIGATTAANGLPLTTNEGFSMTSAAQILPMSAAARHLCLLQSGSGRIAGIITYIDR